MRRYIYWLELFIKREISTTDLVVLTARQICSTECNLQYLTTCLRICACNFWNYHRRNRFPTLGTRATYIVQCTWPSRRDTCRRSLRLTFETNTNQSYEGYTYIGLVHEMTFVIVCHFPKWSTRLAIHRRPSTQFTEMVLARNFSSLYVETTLLFLRNDRGITGVIARRSNAILILKSECSFSFSMLFFFSLLLFF